MTNKISRPRPERLRMRHAYAGPLVIAAMAFGAFGVSTASAHGVAAHATAQSAVHYKATKALTYKKTGTPKLVVSVSDNVAGGRKITKLAITLPKGYGWKRSALVKDLRVKNHRFTHSVKGRVLTVVPGTPTKSLSVNVKRGGISETKKATAAKATKGKVTLKVTEQKATIKTVTPSAIVSTLKTVETGLASGQSSLEVVLNSVSSNLVKTCPTVVGELDTAIASNPQSLQVTDALLTSYDQFLLSSLPTLLGTYTSLTDDVLEPLGYTSNQPLTDLEALAASGNAALGLNASTLCTQLSAILKTDTDKTLTSVENTLESQINGYAGDLTNLGAGLTKLESTLEGLVAGGSSLVSSSQLSTLTGLISSIQTQLTDALGSSSTSNPLASGLSSLLSDLGLSGLLGSGSDPLSGLTSLLGDLGLNL